MDSFETDMYVCIVMELCNGGTLEDYLHEKARLTEDRAVRFLKQIINGFKGLHAVKAMHRDFKTANVLLHNGVCKIADLGFARVLEGSSAQSYLGTPLTMAPEVLQ